MPKKKCNRTRERFDRERRRWDTFMENNARPWKRKFPGKEKRRVEISIQRFDGCPHSHVRIKEEANPVWDSEMGDWLETFYDEGGRGTTWDQKWYQLKNAHAFIKLVWQDWFSPKTHELIHDDASFTERSTSLQRKFNRWQGRTS